MPAHARQRPLRTVVVEDETMFRQLVVSTLARVKRLKVIGEFVEGRPALDFCLREKPDLVVIDLMLPDMNGLEIAAQIRREVPAMNLLIITAHPSEQLPMDLIKLGVNGYIDKTEPIEYLLSAVGTIREGGMFFATHVQAKTGVDPNRVLVRRIPREIPLTNRQREIAQLVASGHMSKEIASQLKLSYRTVEKHRENIMQKVGVHDVASLTRWCLEVGLVDS